MTLRFALVGFALLSLSSAAWPQGAGRGLTGRVFDGGHDGVVMGLLLPWSTLLEDAPPPIFGARVRAYAPWVGTKRNFLRSSSGRVRQESDGRLSFDSIEHSRVVGRDYSEEGEWYFEPLGFDEIIEVVSTVGPRGPFLGETRTDVNGAFDLSQFGTAAVLRIDAVGFESTFALDEGVPGMFGPGLWIEMSRPRSHVPTQIIDAYGDSVPDGVEMIIANAGVRVRTTKSGEIELPPGMTSFDVHVSTPGWCYPEFEDSSDASGSFAPCLPNSIARPDLAAGGGLVLMRTPTLRVLNESDVVLEDLWLCQGEGSGAIAGWCRAPDGVLDLCSQTKVYADRESDRSRDHAESFIVWSPGHVPREIETLGQENASPFPWSGTVEVVLAEGRAPRLRGRVESADGRAGLLVEVREHRHDNLVVRTRTGASGEFEVECPPGRFVVSCGDLHRNVAHPGSGEIVLRSDDPAGDSQR